MFYISAVSNPPPKAPIMNKSEQREVSRIINYSAHLGADYAARALSALYRASMRKSAKTEMLSLAIAYGWNKSPEFII